MYNPFSYIKLRLKIINLKLYIILYSIFFLIQTGMYIVLYHDEVSLTNSSAGNILDFFIYNSENIFILYLFIPIIILIYCTTTMCFEKREYLYILKFEHRQSYLRSNLLTAIFSSVLFVTIYTVITFLCGLFSHLQISGPTHFPNLSFGLNKACFFIYISLILYWLTLTLWFQTAYYLFLNRFIAILITCLPLLWGFIVYKNVFSEMYKFTFFYQIVQSYLATNMWFRFTFWLVQIFILICISAMRFNQIDLQEKKGAKI